MVTSTLTETASGLVEDARRRRNVSKSELATRSGIPRTSLNRKLAGHDEFTLTQLASTCEALGANYSEWLRELAKVAS